MSGVVIKITAGATMEESSVSATGEQINIIANSERATFGIGSDSDLKRAVEKDFGRWPNDAYLHSPTPWGDLYKTYGWEQVTRVLRPVKAQILEITTKPTILATKTLTNKSDFETTFTTNISEKVTDSVSNTWSNSSKLSIEQMFKYEVGFLGTGGGGETKFGFEQQWGKSNTVTKETTVGTETGVSVTLKPGESALVELSASSGKMRVRITYEGYLKGLSAVNYNPTYKGHHFWALPIGGVVGSSNNKVQIVEDIEVGYYSNASATVKNVKTKERMMFYLADHPKEDPIALQDVPQYYTESSPFMPQH